AFSWNPTEAQGPGDYSITVRVSDDGSPAADDTETLMVHVTEDNVAPELEAIGDQSIDEGAEIRLTASATDHDLPVTPLTYSLDAGAPEGASIDPSTGVFSWTPTEAQGPGDYGVTIRVTESTPAEPTHLGLNAPEVRPPGLSSARTFSLHVGE